MQNNNIDNLFRRSIEAIFNTAKAMGKDEEMIKKSYNKAIGKSWDKNGVQPLYDFLNELDIEIEDFKKANSNEINILKFLGFKDEKEEVVVDEER